jgi:hypothetical protein
MEDIEKVILTLMNKKKNVADQMNDTAAYYHGWNAAIDHMLQILRGLR